MKATLWTTLKVRVGPDGPDCPEDPDGPASKETNIIESQNCGQDGAIQTKQI